MYQVAHPDTPGGDVKASRQAHRTTYVGSISVIALLWRCRSCVTNLQVGAGLGLLLISLPFTLGLKPLALGTATRMGPGFVPGLVLVALLLIAFSLLIDGIVRQHRVSQTSLQLDLAGMRGVAAISGGIIAFTLLLNPTGLLPAVAAASYLCSMARPPFRAWRAAALALVNAAAIWLVFIKLLGLNFQAFVDPWQWTY